MIPNPRLVAGALAAGVALACASPPQEPTRIAPPVASSIASAEPETTPEAPPTTFAEINKLLTRVDREPEAERKQTYAVARSALTSLTRESGRPAIVAPVKTPNGGEETRLLPQGRRVETAPWHGGALRIAGERVVTVGDRVVSLGGGRITIWGSEPMGLDAQGATTLSVPAGESRFVLATGKTTAFVLDSETGKTLLESPREGAMLVRAANGQTRFAHQQAKNVNTYEVSQISVEPPSSAAVVKAVVSWPRLVAHDDARGLVAVVRTSQDKPNSLDPEICVVRLADDVIVAKRGVSFEMSFGPFLGARISPDAKSIAFTTLSEARRFHLDTGRNELLKRQAPTGLPLRQPVFTADGQHVCVDAPGDAFPRAKGVPGTSQRCYVAGDVAHVVNLAAPPLGFRRANPEAFQRDGFGFEQTYELVSPGGALVAAILHDGKPAPLAPQRFTIAVYDAATGKQQWNQFFDTMKSLASPPDLSFSADAAELIVDGVRLDARTGTAVDDKPVDSASLAPLMRRFGMNVDGKTLSYMRLGYDVPFFEKGQLVWTVDLTPRPLSIILDPVTLTLALRGHGSKQSIVFASGPTSALAFLPDGSFAKSGDGRDLVCDLGSVLAPIEVCQTKQEIPALRVPATLGELSR